MIRTMYSCIEREEFRDATPEEIAAAVPYKYIKENRDYIELTDGTILKSMGDGRFYDSDNDADCFAEVFDAEFDDDGEIEIQTMNYGLIRVK